jgi:hypothetical protein
MQVRSSRLPPSPLPPGIGGSYQHLLGGFPEKIPLLSDPTHLSDDPHLDTSKGDFLCLLHRIAANNGLEDSGRLTIRNAAREADEIVNVIRVVGEESDLTGEQPQRQGRKVKTSSSSLSGLFSLKLDRVHFDISTPIQIPPHGRRGGGHVPPPAQPSSPHSSSRSSSASELGDRILESLETETNGRTLADLASHFTDNLSELKEALGMLCSSRQVYRYPHYDSRYEEVVLFLHHKHSHFYFGNLPQTLPHLFGRGAVGQEEVEMIPLSQQELLCPWMNIDGTRNQTILTLFVSKLIAVLTFKPQSQISAIHSEFPMLSCTHVAIFLKKLVSEGILLRHSFQFSQRLQSPFHSRGAPIESASLVHCSFSLSPRLWEGKEFEYEVSGESDVCEEGA